MNTRDTMIDIARDAILSRAALDGYAPDQYSPEQDKEGYVVSLLNALHHWCHEHGHDWTAELSRAQSHFEEDLDEFRQSPPGQTLNLKS